MFDARRNKIKVGDTVSLEIPSRNVTGEIREMDEGGLIAGISKGGKKLEVAMGFVTVLVAFRIPVNPEQPIIPNMLKLHSEDGPEESKIQLMQ